MPRLAVLVDDEQTLRAYVSAVLHQGGFSVIEAADGSDALALVRQMRGCVDVLVTDVKMPRMTGIDLVTCVKIDFPDIPILYMSGEPLQESLHNPRSRVLFLQKPFGPQAFLDAVRTVVAPVDANPVAG